MLPILKSSLRLSWLRTLGRLTPDERGLLWRAVLLVAVIRVALWLIPFRRVRQFMRAFGRVPLCVPVDLPVSRLVWAVRSASRRVPMASCLTQSLALQFLLSSTGRSSQLHFGVKKDPEAGFQAHAWVESSGSTLLSTQSEVGTYARMWALEDLSA